MRCNWQRWLWGLIPLIMVSWVAIHVERDRIQQDLTERAHAALADSGLPWASVESKGRDLVLSGRAIEDGEPPRAERALRKVWGVRDVENRAILPRKVQPFIWSARRRGNRIKLSGYVPDRTTRQAVLGLTKAAMPGLDVLDRMNTARGVPSADTWLAGLSFALKQLSSLKQGEARFDDLALSISGEAEDPAAFKAVNTALHSGLPKGITLASSQIAAPVVSPYTWSAQFAGGQLVMAGHVAGGEKTRAELLAAAKAAAPALNTVDRMEPAEGAPQGWADVAVALMKVLVQLESGTIEMKDAVLTVGGVAPDEPQAQSIRAALRTSLPPAFTFVDQIRVREVKAPEPAPVAPAPAAPSKQAEPAPRDLPHAPSAAGPAPNVPAGPPPEQLATVPQPPAEASSKMAAPAPNAPAAQPAPAPPQPPTEPAREPKQAAPMPPSPSVPALKEHAAVQPQAPADAVPKQAAPMPPSAPALKEHAASQRQAPAEAVPKHAPEPPSSPKVAPAPEVAMTAPQPPATPQPPAVRDCQENLNKITSAGHINFASDSASLESSSLETLDRLAAAAKACPGVRIAIEGHTDAEGSAGYNQRLSVRRARAVVTYLVNAGADRRQLEAVGYGRTRPAAPNDTEENMAKNRRIEFSVRQQ